MEMMGAIPTFHHMYKLYIAGSRSEDALSPMPHPLTNPKQICKAGCPRSKCGVPDSQHQHSFASGAVVSCLHNAGVVLVKLQISHFLLRQSLWESAMRNRDLGPGLELPLAATSREQGFLNKVRASPLVPETPSSPHVLMRASASANGETRNVFSAGINAAFATQQAASTAVKSTLFSLLSEGFCFPSKSLVFSNVSKLLMSPGSQNSWYLQGHKVLLTYSGQFKQTYPLGARP